MKGFVIAGVMLAVIVSSVVGVTCYYHARIGEIYEAVSEAEGREEMAAVFEEYERCRLFISLCAPDTLTHEVERAFDECMTEDEDKKGRLLLALSELRRQVGFSVESII